MVTCCIPWQGKQKYQVTNVGVKSKLSLLVLQRIIKCKMNKFKVKLRNEIHKITLTNANCKLF